MSVVGNRPAAADASSPARGVRDVVADLLLLAALWAASLLVVSPVGDFPLNDDWSFGLTVKRLLQTGDFRPCGFTSMPLITHTFWGALFCSFAGFSFNALRLSTLVLSLCSLLVVYLLVRQVHPSRLLAVVAALTFGFNPIYYPLSNTFMTDVPFTALLLASAWFFARNLQGGSQVCLLCGLALALAATLCRQLGLAVPLAFAACLLWRRGLAIRWIARALLPLAVCLGTLLAFQHWLRATGRLPSLYSLKDQELLTILCSPNRLVPGLARHTGTALLYLGWFALPVLLLVFPAARAWPSRRRLWAAILSGFAFGLCAMVVLFLFRGPMPTAGNIILAQGVGPVSLRDVQILTLPNLPSLGRGFWLVVTAASLLGGALLVAAAAGAVAEARLLPTRAPLRGHQVTGVFLLLCGMVYLGPILVIGGWDRYYVPALPFLLAGAAGLTASTWQGAAPIRLAPALLVLGLLSVFAVLGTRDYLAWNRVRWTAFNDLLASGNATPAEVDGGFECNGWYLYDPAYKASPDKSWWWVRGDSYVLAFGGIPGWTPMQEYPYDHWLPRYTGKITVLRKESPP